MAELLLPHAARNPQGRALADDYGETSWAEFQDRTNRLIHVLRAAGIVPGDRVAVHSGNRREVYEVAMACLHAGFSVVQTNWNYKADELAFVLTDSDARVLIVDDQYADVADEAVREAKDVQMMLGLRSGGHSNGTFATYERALASAPSDEPVNQVGGADASARS